MKGKYAAASVTRDEYGRLMLLVPCEGGTIEVTATQDDEYQEVTVDFKRNDGKIGQMALIGTGSDMLSTHVYVWDGAHEDAVEEIEYHQGGEWVCYE